MSRHTTPDEKNIEHEKKTINAKVKLGRLLMIVGAVMVLAAAGLAIYNAILNRRFEDRAKDVMNQLEAQREDADAAGDGVASDMAEALLTELTIRINGIDWVGTLLVPSLEIELPVTASYTYDYLSTGLCRYSGTVAGNDLVICGHNTRSYLQKLHEIKEGDTVIFTDCRNVAQKYVVTELLSIGGRESDKLYADADTWDLSVFTCNYGGRTRFVVRCTKAENE